jgi:hypothetical protein
MRREIQGFGRLASGGALAFVRAEGGHRVDGRGSRWAWPLGSRTRQIGLVLHGLAGARLIDPGLRRVWATRLYPGLRRTCLSGSPGQRPQGRNQAGRGACGLKRWAWMWVLVDSSGGLGGNGLRVAGFGVRMGGKWLWGLGFRGFRKFEAGGDSTGWRCGLRPKGERRTYHRNWGFPKRTNRTGNEFPPAMDSLTASCHHNSCAMSVLAAVS